MGSNGRAKKMLQVGTKSKQVSRERVSSAAPPCRRIAARCLCCSLSPSALMRHRLAKLRGASTFKVSAIALTAGVLSADAPAALPAELDASSTAASLQLPVPHSRGYPLMRGVVITSYEARRVSCSTHEPAVAAAEE